MKFQRLSESNRQFEPQRSVSVRLHLLTGRIRAGSRRGALRGSEFSRHSSASGPRILSADRDGSTFLSRSAECRQCTATARCPLRTNQRSNLGSHSFSKYTSYVRLFQSRIPSHSVMPEIDPLHHANSECFSTSHDPMSSRSPGSAG